MKRRQLLSLLTVFNMIFCFSQILMGQTAVEGGNFSKTKIRSDIKPIEGTEIIEKRFPSNTLPSGSEQWLDQSKSQEQRWLAIENSDDETYWEKVNFRQLNLKLKPGASLLDEDIQKFFKKFKLTGKINHHFRGYKTLYIVKVPGSPNRNNTLEIIKYAKENLPGIYVLDPIPKQ